MLLWIILLAFVNDIQSVNANSFSYDRAYHTEKKIWKDASDECGSNGLEFDKQVFTDIGVLYDKVFWIGMAIYDLTTPWIEVLGCYTVPGVQDVTKSLSIVLCQKKCASSLLFGYSESTESCFCQHYERSSVDINDCMDSTDSKYSFMYKVFTGNVSGKGDGKCSTLTCQDGNNRLTSANCNDTDDNGRISRCRDGYIVGWGKPYLNSQQVCLERSQLLLPPESYCQSNDHQTEGIRSWTDVFRAKTEAKLTKAEAGSKEPLFCLAGSYTEQDIKRELIITRRNCSDQLQFVCRLGAASSTTQSQIIIATQEMKKDSSDSFDIGPVIGGIVAAVILVAILLVVISCKIRSCGFFKTANKDKQQVSFSTAVCDHSQNSEVKKSVTPTSNESYGITSINSFHTYAVVNKIQKEGLQITEDNSTETSFGEYDRLDSVSKRQTDSNTNVYDSHAGIRNESDPTYDSSNHGGRKLRLDNDVYDHTDTLSTDGSDYGYSSRFKSE